MQKPPLTFLDRSSGPSRLDRYELVAEIATGGMGTVYLARIAGAGGFSRFVAIKRLHAHLAEEQEFVAMFLDEARLAAGIHHPNVVPILDVGESKAGYYLVLDYVEGESLGGLRRDASNRGYDFAPSVLARIAVDTLLGLHAAHELRDDHNRPLHIVHRDVSPQNILVGIDGMSRLIDFGIARAARRMSTTRTGEVKGKLAYMAPEQVKRGLVDRRTDVFAAGIVFWEMLTARRLFRGDSDLETLNRVVVGDIPDVRELNRQVPAGLAVAIARALVRESDGRFPTAQAFADAIVESTAVASVQEVASYTEFLIGDDIRRRREAVRKWLRPNAGRPDDAEDDEPELGTQTLMVHKAKRPEEWARTGSSLPSVAEDSDLEDQTLTQQLVRGAKKDVRPAPMAPRIVGLPGSPSSAFSPGPEVLEVKTVADLGGALRAGSRPPQAPPPRPSPAAPPPPAPPPPPPGPSAASSFVQAPPASSSYQPAPPSSGLPGGFVQSPSYPPPPTSSALPNRIPGPLPSPAFDSLSVVPMTGFGPAGPGPGVPSASGLPAQGWVPQASGVLPGTGTTSSGLSAADNAALAGRSRLPIGVIIAGIIGVLAFAGFLALVGGWLATDSAPTPPPGTIAPKR